MLAAVPSGSAVDPCCCEPVCPETSKTLHVVFAGVENLCGCGDTGSVTYGPYAQVTAFILNGAYDLTWDGAQWHWLAPNALTFDAFFSPGCVDFDTTIVDDLEINVTCLDGVLTVTVVSPDNLAFLGTGLIATAIANTTNCTQPLALTNGTAYVTENP